MIDIELKIRDIIENIVGKENCVDLDNDTDFVDYLGLDSLDCVDVIINIEKDFSINISDNVIETWFKNPTIQNFAIYTKKIIDTK